MVSEPLFETRPAAETRKKSRLNISSISEKPLLVASTVFPFTLFPDQVEIYRDRVVVTYWQFFFSKRVFPFIIKDLLSCSIDTNLLFGTVRFDLILSQSDLEPVHHLWRSDAIKIREYVTGLLAAEKEGVDLKNLSHDEVIEHIERIGTSVV